MSTSESFLVASLPEALAYELEELGLSPYEARVLLGLLRLGAVTTAQLARQSGVPRTSTYQVLNDLSERGLAARVATDGPAMWASPGRDEVFERLHAIEEERLRQHRARADRLREKVAEAFPEDPLPGGPYVHLIQSATQVSQMYDRLLAGAQSELLVFSRAPYSDGADLVNPLVLEALQRGVATQVLYEAEQWHDPSAESFRAAMATYHDAGVEGRLVDELPLKLAVADRKVALLAMTDPVLPDIGFPTTLFVEHPGYASLQADAFEKQWAQSEPFPDAGE